MKTLSQPVGIFAALALLTAGLPARAESFTADKKKPDTADRIDFKVDLQPADPFSDANKVGAPREFSRGEVMRLVIQGTPRPGFHTYPLTRQVKDQESFKSQLTFVKNADVQLLWPTTETPPQTVEEKGVGVFLEQSKPFTWTQDLYIKPDAKPGPEQLHFTVHVIVCDESCVYGDHAFEVPFTVIDSPVAAAPPDLNERLQDKPRPDERLSFKGQGLTVVALPSPAWAPLPPVGATARDGGPAPVITTNPTTAVRPPAAPGFWDLLGFMWQGVLWGALSLITPCVFPMIPITVSFFLKQSEKSHTPALAGPATGRSGVTAALPGLPAARKGRSPVLLAAIYSSTIALVLTVAGVLLIPIVQPFSQHWATNLVLGGLFVFFALSLFGMYDIVLPSGLGRMTAAGEGRGGLIGVVFMALTFTVISFACVAPFYGGFIALSASASSAGDWLKLVLGALAFSVTFALPFFILALFPFLLKKLPKSGSWLNTVKVVMGFLELAAAFKFLRAAELNFSVRTEFLTYDLVLGVYIALSVACGLYLLGLFRLPHDHGVSETLSVPRLLFSIAFLGLALYLLPGLFKTGGGDQQRPDGTVFAWLDSFLLPEDSGPVAGATASSGGAPAAGQLAWVGDLKQALKQGEAEKKLVFLDFTAQTCTNCKYNERNIFIKPEIKSLLRQYVLVHLYTDNVPPEYQSPVSGAENREFMHDKFGTGQLPLYAIVKPKAEGGFEVIGKYDESKINNVSGFARFLQDPLPALSPDARADAR